MALRDHFRPPLIEQRDWHSFHHSWASVLAFELNAKLPKGYFAKPNVQFGIEIDVAAFDEASEHFPEAAGWSPPSPTSTIALPLLTDLVEVMVYGTEVGPILAAAIELVSPSIKDRPVSRDAFTSKCRTYLQEGLGLIVVDLVSIRRSNLHNALIGQLDPTAQSTNDDLYAVAYHPIKRDGEPRLDLWTERLSIGGPLPTLPLWLQGGPCLPVDLGASYDRTCRELRFPPAEA